METKNGYTTKNVDIAAFLNRQRLSICERDL